jgi:hypothetical protein
VHVNGNIFWYWPETGGTELLTGPEHQQFLALYPQHGRLAYYDESESIASSEFILDTQSDASSEFVLDPDAELIEDNTDIYTLPQRPDTPTPPSPPKKASALPDRPCTPAPHSEPEYPEPPASPYRRRASSFSWTGLEETVWGKDNFVDEETGLLAVRKERDAELGAYGTLSHCSWGGHLSAEQAPVSLGPELKLTTDEGDEYWLDDSTQAYQYEYAYEPEYQDTYGHVCDARCGHYYYNQYEYAIEDDEEEGCGQELVVQEQQGHGQEHVEQGSYELGTIEEEDEEEVESDIDDMTDLLDRLEAALHDEVDSGAHEQAPVVEKTNQLEVPVLNTAVANELPLWIRDPTYVSNKSWADIMDDEDEEY